MPLNNVKAEVPCYKLVETNKNVVLLNVSPCGSCRNRVFALVFHRSLRRLLVTSSVIPSSLILVTLVKEALSSSQASVLTRARA
jgi:hypothetical protein